MFYWGGGVGNLYTARNISLAEYDSGTNAKTAPLAVGTTPVLKYTGCPRRNVPDFGWVFLMLKYTDITQNTYVQS